MDIGLDKRTAYDEGYKDGYMLGTVHGMNACTDEEFKAEAKRRGYNLVKIPEKLVELLPCMCGRKRISEWWSIASTYYKCPKCGLTAPSDRTARQARINWNKMIEEKMKEERK